MNNGYEYQRVYQCSKCSGIQARYNNGICKSCGNEGIVDKVARWIDTTSLLEILTLRFSSSGYWELKE